MEVLETTGSHTTAAQPSGATVTMPDLADRLTEGVQERSTPTAASSSSSNGAGGAAAAAGAGGNSVLFSHYPGLLASFPLQYAYLRASEGNLIHGAGSEVGFATTYPSFVGWPGLTAADAMMAARMCLLQVMGYPEAMQQQQQLLLQQLLAQSVLASGRAAVPMATAGGHGSLLHQVPLPLQQQRQLNADHASTAPLCDAHSVSASEDLALVVDAVKQEPGSPSGDDRVGFRPYTTASRNGNLKPSVALSHTGPRQLSSRPPSSSGGSAPEAAAVVVAPTLPLRPGGARDVLSRTLTPSATASQTQNKKNKGSSRFSQLRSPAASAAAAATARSARSPPPCSPAEPHPGGSGAEGRAVPSGGVRHSHDARCSMAPVVVAPAAAAAATTTTELRGCDLPRPLSKLDLAECRRRSRRMRSDALTSDVDEEAEEAQAEERKQRLLVIRTPLPVPSDCGADLGGGPAPPPEKRRLLAALGLVPTHEATAIKCSMAKRRKARYGGEPEADLELSVHSLSPLLRQLTSDRRQQTSGSSSHCTVCPELEHVDKLEFLQQLGLRSSSSVESSTCASNKNLRRDASAGSSNGVTLAVLPTQAASLLRNGAGDEP